MLMGLALLLAVPSIAQVDLINKVKDNQSDNAKEGFQWESVVDVERLAVENQGASGTMPYFLYISKTSGRAPPWPKFRLPCMRTYRSALSS